MEITIDEVELWIYFREHCNFVAKNGDCMYPGHKEGERGCGMPKCPVIEDWKHPNRHVPAPGADGEEDKCPEPDAVNVSGSPGKKT